MTGKNDNPMVLNMRFSLGPIGTKGRTIKVESEIGGQEKTTELIVPGQKPKADA